MSIYTAIKHDPDRRYDPPDIPEIENDDELLSNCCGANPWGELDYIDYGEYEEVLGICSACREHSLFSEE